MEDTSSDTDAASSTTTTTAGVGPDGEGDDGGAVEDGGTLGRTPAGRIEAPEGYIEYSGQVVIRERYATVQRWKESGWPRRDRALLPYILNESYCRGSRRFDPKHEYLGETEIEVYYVDESRRVRYQVEAEA